jgi:hypothetical protein
VFFFVKPLLGSLEFFPKSTQLSLCSNPPRTAAWWNMAFSCRVKLRPARPGCQEISVRNRIGVCREITKGGFAPALRLFLRLGFDLQAAPRGGRRSQENPIELQDGVRSRQVAFAIDVRIAQVAISAHRSNAAPQKCAIEHQNSVRGG